MREGDSGGLVSRGDIESLSDPYDRWENAIDPASAKAKAAEIEFKQEVEKIFDSRVKESYPSLTLRQFEALIRSQCRKLIASQKRRS